MLSTLATTAPNVNPLTVLTTGATEIRTVFAADQIPGIVLAYMAGLKVVFAISIGTSGAAFVLSLFAGWKRLDIEKLKDAGGAA
jgi:hypothetical protein